MTYTEYADKLHDLYTEYWTTGMDRDTYREQHTNLIVEAVADLADELDDLRALRTFARDGRESALIEEAIDAYAERNEVTLCDACRCNLNADPIEFENGDGETLRFCCYGCAASAGWHETPSHEWVHEDGPETVYVERVGIWFACEDDAREAGYELCGECGEWFDSNSRRAVILDDYDASFCSATCANRSGYFRCGYCLDWHNENSMYTVIVSEDGETAYWCEDCYESHARDCYRCGDSVHEDVVHYDEYDDPYCPSCARRHCANGLHEYGYTPELVFRGNAKNSPYLGVELETDGGNERASYVNDLGNIEGFNEHFYMTKDGSLNNGVEITSHPCTLSYHANELYEMYESIRSTALGYGFQSHNGGRCGLHVHLNRDFFGKSIDSQDVGGYKMMRLLQRFEANFTKFSRRRDNGWCNYYTNQNYGPDEQGEPDSISRVLDKARDMKYERRHEQALNFQHDATFEFRIFRGTLNLSTFFASLGMVNGLAHVAKMHSAHYVETVEWSELMRDVVKACDEPKSREFLREYLESKELL